MIPVHEQAEPHEFDKLVRQKGLKWKSEKQAKYGGVLPAGLRFPPYWNEQRELLWSAYGGVCAYLAVHVELPGCQTDHFLPTHGFPDEAYEWRNLRLCAAAVNAGKRNTLLLADPFSISQDSVFLRVFSGELYVNTELDQSQIFAIAETIRILKLNKPSYQKMRFRHFAEYVRGDVSEAYLQKKSPFVWYEAKRQGLLK